MSKYIFNNDTDILEFLEQLRENGIQIWGEGEKIRYRSKNRQLAPETLRILKMASTVDSLMSWNYQSVEKILNQLTKMHFRTAKLSETLLLAIKAR